MNQTAANQELAELRERERVFKATLRECERAARNMGDHATADRYLLQQLELEGGQ